LCAEREIDGEFEKKSNFLIKEYYVQGERVIFFLDYMSVTETGPMKPANTVQYTADPIVIGSTFHI